MATTTITTTTRMTISPRKSTKSLPQRQFQTHPAIITPLNEVLSRATVLHQRLLTIGSIIPSVQQSCAHLATKIQSHWRALDLLSQRLSPTDASTTIYNEEALFLTKAIVTSTSSIFTAIEKMIPTPKSDDQETWRPSKSQGHTLEKNKTSYSIPLKPRLKFIYLSKRNKIDSPEVMVQLDLLLTTTQLLTNVLVIGEKVKWSRTFVKGAGARSQGTIYETLKVQGVPAKDGLAESIRTCGKSLSAYMGVGETRVAIKTFDDASRASNGTGDLRRGYSKLVGDDNESDEDAPGRAQNENSQNNESTISIAAFPAFLVEFASLLKTADSNWSERDYVDENMRIWWRTLMNEWTAVV